MGATGRAKPQVEASGNSYIIKDSAQDTHAS